MRFQRIIAVFAVMLTLSTVSCAKMPDGTEEKEIPPVRIVTTDEYTLRIERGKNKVEIVAPEKMRGIAVEFEETGQYMTSGKLRMPMSETVAAAWRDWLTMAYPEDVTDKALSGEKSDGEGVKEEFDSGGAHFVIYGDGKASVTRGGVTREATVEAEETPDSTAAAE